MIDWIKRHPYLSGGFVLAAIVLFLILRGRSSSGGTTVVQGSAGPSDAIQAANLQAGVQQQGIQAAADAQSQGTAAALAAHLADVQAQQDATQATRDVALQNILSAAQTGQYASATQLAAVNSTNAAQVSIADTAAGAGVQVAAINANAGVQIAGIQGDVAKYAADTQLKALVDTNKTSLGIAGINLQGLMDTNATAATINLQNNQTQQLGITTQGQVQTDAIDTAGAVQLHGIDVAGAIDALSIQSATQLQQSNQDEYWKSIFANDRWGGGQNQVAALATITNQPAIGVAAATGQSASNAASASMWSNIIGGLTGAAGKIIPAVV